MPDRTNVRWRDGGEKRAVRGGWKAREHASETVRRIIADNPDLAPGDVYVTNDPYRGGSHLPDVTVITPVHSESGELRFFTASRAHHAEPAGAIDVVVED